MSSESKPNPEFQPLHNICEFLNALHIYADEAKQGLTRFVEANHYCSHVRRDLRQCLVYDGHGKDARLVGVEYMVPRHVYEKLGPEEQKLWHSHEFEVKSGMLVLPKPEGWDQEEWEKAEYEAMKGVADLYGKTWHFWQVDRGDELPLGYPKLMGSLTHGSQLQIDHVLGDRNKRLAVDHKDKAKKREDISLSGVHPNADTWWEK